MIRGRHPGKWHCSKGFQQKYGTLGILHGKQAACGIAYKNFQDCKLPDDMDEAIDPQKTIDKYQVCKSSFPGCPIGCGRALHFTYGPYAGLTTEAPQWATVGSLQGKLGVPEPQFMFKAHAYCNQMGLDIDPAKYNRMLDEYCDLRGWDRETSYPTRKTLEDFGARKCGQ